MIYEYCKLFKYRKVCKEGRTSPSKESLSIYNRVYDYS